MELGTHFMQTEICHKDFTSNLANLRLVFFNKTVCLGDIFLVLPLCYLHFLLCTPLSLCLFQFQFIGPTTLLKRAEHLRFIEFTVTSVCAELYFTPGTKYLARKISVCL